MKHELDRSFAKPGVAPQAPTPREIPYVPTPLPQRFPERVPTETPPPVRVPELVPTK